ncbi:membrane protein DedA, SNARE-associated domain [Ruaniaceae bacterium KH17]|nr:membrane protein DedA, SNARE-associated domain [Ruaniaceae bacterium KH17]
MMDFIHNGPFAAVYIFLLCVVFCRAQGTYWLGRWGAKLAIERVKPKSAFGQKAQAWLDSGASDSGIRALHRWGLIVLPFSFLTVGFQTAVNAGAGLIRISWRKYTFAMFFGCLAWALIYSTIGFAVWGAALSAAAGSPWGIAATVAFVSIFGATMWISRRRKRLETEPLPADVEVPADEITIVVREDAPEL